jgi:protein mago nashi
LNLTRTLTLTYISSSSVGHTGCYGHEFLEFELDSTGRLRYANNSNYKRDSLIRKEAYVSPLVVREMYGILDSAKIVAEDDAQWPEPNIDGKQELEIVSGRTHICFTVRYKR